MNGMESIFRDSAELINAIVAKHGTGALTVLMDMLSHRIREETEKDLTVDAQPPYTQRPRGTL